MKSDNVKKGMQQAPHRSLFNALGFTKEEMDKPLVGIVSSYNEIVPGHMNLDKIVNAVKLGVAEAAPTPAPSATQMNTFVSAAQAPTAASAEEPTN
jgi:dihydroxy-acid dehydratase